MLKLKNIFKFYSLGDEKVAALDNINISFNKSEFVSILGSSGSGKTTLLNIIGGLDRYSSGDLIVDGKSTKEFKDKEWDSYRNSTIGFVFQSYNLIPHLSVLDNVSIALSLSGVSSVERNKIAKESLVNVGLEKHIYKRSNELSGGQMQRVAIARALVNNPKILLADEPTGALDSQTSIQIMELIQEISKDRLVIMVTHNPELAEKYSDRIVRLSDGCIVEDTRPYEKEIEKKDMPYKTKKTSMSFGSALKSSLKNLFTKKTRTLITVFAGSIGIISIGLVQAMSGGMNNYVDQMQKDTLSGLPITISQITSTNFNRIRSFGDRIDNKTESRDKEVITAEAEEESHTNIYSQDVLENGYTFIDFLEKNAGSFTSSINYVKGYNIKAVTKNYQGNYQEVLYSSGGLFGGNILSELSENSESIMDKYEVLASEDKEFKYPKSPYEAVLVVDYNSQLSKEQLKALGFDSDKEISYSDIIGKTYSIISNDNYYEQIGDEFYFTKSVVDEEMYKSGYEITIVGILKAKDSTTSILTTGINYTKSLVDMMTDMEKDSDIVKIQSENPNLNILSTNQGDIDGETYNSVMEYLGGKDTPVTIFIYPSSFENKEKIIGVIDNYNELIQEKFGQDTTAYKTNSIVYTDMAESIADTLSTMIDTITIVLTAFAAISLGVSSVMIGIITYVSVVERTKEIGIMRAIGARKKDISRIFNAEAMIIGFGAGLLGVIIAMLIVIPINNFIENSLDIAGFTASLPLTSAVGLVVLSIVLTFIGGLLPSRIASKKDPVVALRSE